MRVYHELCYGEEQQFLLLNGTYKLQRQSLHQSLEDCLFDAKKHKDMSFFLLDEQRFSFFSFSIIKDFLDPVSIHDLKTILQDKQRDIQKEYGKTGNMLFYNIDTIYIDGQSSQYILGKTGQIFFRLSLVYIKRTTLNLCNTILGNIFENSFITIYPASFYTQSLIKQKLNKDAFHMLYIHETYSKLIHINNGFYERVESVNRGSAMLKDIYKENNILGLFYKENREVEANPLGKELVTQSVDFFTHMLSKWLKEFMQEHNDLILITPLVSHSHFQDYLSKWYKHYINGYILPLHTFEDMHTRGRERGAEEIDMLALLNGEEQIKNLHTSFAK